MVTAGCLPAVTDEELLALTGPDEALARMGVIGPGSG